MAIETAEDLAALFHPDDFGVEMIAHMVSASVPFFGVPTTGHTFEQPGSTAQVSMLVPRIIAQRSTVADLMQNDEIELPGGTRVIVVDVQTKGELAIIHYHERW